MELDLVDPMPVPVVGDQPGLEPVGLVRPALRFRGAGQLPEPVQVADGPGRALARHAGQQRGIGRDVVVDQGRGLVEHLVGRHTRKSTRR
jgi:hypothetical protein